MIKIRGMSRYDYEGVYNLWVNTFGMGLNYIDDSKQGINKYLLRNPNTCFAAEKNDQVIGAILSGYDGRRGDIHHTAICKHKQRIGIGEALLNKAMKALENGGIKKVLLAVFEKNENGNAFWEKPGFAKRDDLVYQNKTIERLN